MLGQQCSGQPCSGAASVEQARRMKLNRAVGCAAVDARQLSTSAAACMPPVRLLFCPAGLYGLPPLPHPSSRCCNCWLTLLAVSPLHKRHPVHPSCTLCTPTCTAQVALLFRNHDDLLREFTYFLPDNTPPLGPGRGGRGSMPKKAPGGYKAGRKAPPPLRKGALGRQGAGAVTGRTVAELGRAVVEAASGQQLAGVCVAVLPCLLLAQLSAHLPAVCHAIIPGCAGVSFSISGPPPPSLPLPLIHRRPQGGARAAVLRARQAAVAQQGGVRRLPQV